MSIWLSPASEFCELIHGEARDSEMMQSTPDILVRTHHKDHIYTSENEDHIYTSENDYQLLVLGRELRQDGEPLINLCGPSISCANSRGSRVQASRADVL